MSERDRSLPIRRYPSCIVSQKCITFSFALCKRVFSSSYKTYINIDIVVQNRSCRLLPTSTMCEPQKVIFQVCLHDCRSQRKAMKAISKVIGINSIEVDVDGNNLTAVGVFDLICGHRKLKKVCKKTKIKSVEIVKPEEPKKEEPKKEEPKKEEEPKNPVWHYQPPYNPCYMPQPFYVAVEETPHCCVIF